MLTINPSSLRATLGDAAAHAATGGSPASLSADPAGFASLLRQTRTVAVPAPAPMPTTRADPNPAASASTRTDEAPNEAEGPPEPADATNRTRALPKGKPRAADAAAPARPTETSVLDAKKASKAAAGDSGDAPTAACNAPEKQARATGAAIDPSVMQWLAGLQHAVSGAPDATAVDAGAKTATEAADGSAVEPRGTAKGLRAAELKADAELKDKVAQGKTQLADAAGASQFAGALAEQRKTEKTTPLPISVGGGAKEAATAAAAALAAAPGAGTGAAAPAAVAVAIATPVGAPDFAQALGLRLSVLARDGVQTAELHLNPADMGPVSVQIVMDGSQARVDFGADMAATRQAIEAGLPELASALRDAGFTLAGGGVSQHAGGRSGGNAPGSSHGDGQRGIVAEDDVKRVATAARRIVTQGGVDLFA